MKLSVLARCAVLLCILFLIAGCGRKGKLVLPESNVETVPEKTW